LGAAEIAVSAAELEARGESKPDPSLIGQATALARLIGQPMGREQHIDGSYAGSSRALTIDDIAGHLAGSITLAFQTIDGDGKSRFLAIDIDERFPARLPLVANVLAARGLVHASIVTSGSSPDRGKVCVFFARPRSAASMSRLGADIVAEARSRAPWGIHRPEMVTVFPQSAGGGIVRLAGRNRRPDRHASATDITLSLDGGLRSWTDVAPATRSQLPAVPERIEVAKRGRWVDALLVGGLTWAGGTAKVVDVIFRLASEACRFSGPGVIGEVEFRRWLRQIESASPDLANPSPTTGDRRPVLAWERHGERAWIAAKKRTLSSPGLLSRSEIDNVPEAHRIVLEVIANYAKQKGVTPWAVGISYRQIAKHGGLPNAKAAYRAVIALQAIGLVVIHDRGVAGRRGQKTILGLVTKGKTREEVCELGNSAWNVRRQRPVANHARSTGRRVHRRMRFGAGAIIALERRESACV